MFLPNKHNPWLRLGLALLAGLLFLLGYQWGNQYQRAGSGPPAIQGVLVRPPPQMPELALKDAYGEVFNHDTLAQDWTLLTFGDLAGASGQLAIQRLIDVYNRLADRDALHRALRLVLVSAGDAPDLARQFSALSPGLHVLGGGPEAIASLRDALGAGEQADQPLYVFAPGGYLVAILPKDESRTAMAGDVAALHADVDWLLAQPE